MKTIGVPAALSRTKGYRFAAIRARPIAFALVLITALGACSGSGDSSHRNQLIGNTSTGGSDPPLPTANGNTGGGIWWGTLSRDGGIVNSAMCLLVEAGELACVLVATSKENVVSYFDDNIVGAVHGTAQVSNTTQASGSGKIYATPGHVLADGTSMVADFTITGGSLSEQNSRLDLTFTSLGQESTFSGFYDHYYATVGGTIVWPPDGVYTTFDIFGDPASLSIDPNGALFLQSESGCTGNGQMTNIDPDHVRNTPGYNAYTVNVTLGDCQELNGAYRGLATLIDFAWVNGTDNLVIAVFNDTTAIVGEAVK